MSDTKGPMYEMASQYNHQQPVIAARPEQQPLLELSDIVTEGFAVILAERRHIVAWDHLSAYRIYREVEPGVYTLVERENLHTRSPANAVDLARGCISAVLV